MAEHVAWDWFVTADYITRLRATSQSASSFRAIRNHGNPAVLAAISGTRAENDDAPRCLRRSARKPL